MEGEIISYLYNSAQNVTFFMLMVKAVLHIIFAGAIAKDAAMVQKNYGKTQFVGPMTWAIATLVGGVFVALMYWLIHHSSLRTVNH
jgi:uncharacterized integral membrane protein